MRIDIQDVLFWMDAIRDSDDRYRTLESFWKGQINSKIWLIENIKKIIDKKDPKVIIHGGWNGVLASLIFNEPSFGSPRVTSIDIDADCKETAYTINKRYEIEGRFQAITADMCTYTYNDADIVINTSMEHITSEQYKQWYSLIPDKSLIVVQSNNFFELDEHINCHNNIEDFVASVKMKKLYFADSLVLPKYTRFMAVGKK